MGARRKPPAAAAPFRITHPERVVFADPEVTKGELAAFYQRIAAHLLPDLIGRPVMLMRCPAGGAGECFFQKHRSPGFPAAVHEVNDTKDRQRWLYIEDLAGLMGLVQMNALEFHVWGSTVANLERADRLVIDLDPGPGVAWKSVIETALALRARLQAAKLQSFVRTTGGKGLHVVIPVRPACDWERARAFSRALAESLVREQPTRYLSVATKAERTGKIFIDYLRNGRGATAVCSYSLRNRPGAPIATPLTWEELPRLRGGDQFGYANIERRLARLPRDPWAGIDTLRQSLPKPKA